MAQIGRIYIDGEIIPDAWNWWGEEATSLISVRNQIAALGDFDELEYWVFSPGGFCFEGWAIADYLLTLGKKLTAIAYGQCASIATIIFSAASVRKITANCDFMIHLPWGGVEGNEHEVLAYYNELVIEGDRIANRYATVTGGDKVAIKAQLAKDYHMNGQQAVDAKYATELMSAEPQALKAKSNRPLQSAVAYLRRPKNIALKADNVPGTGSAIVIPDKPNPGAATQSNEMSKPTQNSALAGLFASFATSIYNVLSGKPAKALDVNTESGQTIVIDVTGDKPAIGDKVTLKDTGAAAPDGDYTASGDDKSVYTVTSGAISNIVTPETDDTADNAQNNGGATDGDKDKEIADLKQEIADLKSTQANAAKETQTRLDLMAKALGMKESQQVTVSSDGTAPKSVTGEDKPLTAVERKRAREAEAAKK